MIWEMIQAALQFAAIYIISIIMHEVGHMFYFREIGNNRARLYLKWKKPILLWIEAGDDEDYKNLTMRQYINLNLAGVAAGLLTILVSSIIGHWLYLIILFPYIAGSWQDITEIYSTLVTNYSHA